jgi:translation initiation factor IF-2
MTEDRDFKRIVRDRATRTGESYQAARRALEQRKRPPFAALATSTFERAGGRVLGCVMEAGVVSRGMQVQVTASDGSAHQGVVASLRHRWVDVDSVSHGDLDEFGLLLDPRTAGRSRRA